MDIQFTGNGKLDKSSMMSLVGLVTLTASQRFYRGIQSRGSMAYWAVNDAPDAPRYPHHELSTDFGSISSMWSHLIQATLVLKHQPEDVFEPSRFERVASTLSMLVGMGKPPTPRRDTRFIAVALHGPGPETKLVPRSGPPIRISATDEMLRPDDLAALRDWAAKAGFEMEVMEVLPAPTPADADDTRSMR